MQPQLRDLRDYCKPQERGRAGWILLYSPKGELLCDTLIPDLFSRAVGQQVSAIWPPGSLTH